MIIVIDLGGQYAHLICRRIRELGVYSELASHTISATEIERRKPEGIVLSGGPASVYEKGSPQIDKKILNLGIPVLGICYGHQLIAKYLGGKVIPSQREYGRKILNVRSAKGIFSGLKNKEPVWASHGDSVTELKGFEIIGSTDSCKLAAYASDRLRIYGIQFHAEVEHTPAGMRILRNFLKLCNAKKDWKISGLQKKLVAETRKVTGSSGVIMAVSGGVDSLVASVIIKKATPNVHCVFVDNGLLRKNEAGYVKTLYNEIGFAHFYHEDASKLFLQRLKGIAEPEEKRKIIGKTFVEVFEKKANSLKKKHGEIKFLGQGTIYPDRIESAQPSSTASRIKTHHNVGGLPPGMKLKLVEPLEDLYKDEVRKLGLELGIQKEALYRHPFPGPGLAVRILGEVTEDRLRMAREADAIFDQELRRSGYYEKTWQALAALLPVKSVGVMGDARTYQNMVALRAVTSKDAMTADWAKLPHELLEKISSRITSEVRGVNRVVYDITQKPPATIEYE